MHLLMYLSIHKHKLELWRVKADWYFPPGGRPPCPIWRVTHNDRPSLRHHQRRLPDSTARGRYWRCPHTRLCLYRWDDRHHTTTQIYSSSTEVRRNTPAQVSDWPWRHQPSDNRGYFYCFRAILWYVNLNYRSNTDVWTIPWLVPIFTHQVSQNIQPYWA